MRTTLLKAVLWGLVGLALLAPTWSPTSQPLGTGRLGESATLLTDGRVLAAGGEINVQGAAVASVEIFDSAKSAWVAAAPMAQARAWHTATMLRNGAVLVVGGSNGMSSLASSELFNPDSASWVAAGTLATPLAFHTATLLANGTVLVVGQSTSQIFTPVPAGWSAPANAPFTQQHTATLLPNGTVLVVGGLDALGQASGQADIYDPVHNTWTAVGGLATPRFAHTATLTPGGDVAVVGGFNGNFTNELASTEVFNVQAQTWTTLQSLLPVPAAEQSATLIPDGHVIAAAGMGPDGPLSDANRLDLTQNWNWVPSLSPTVYLQAATVLPTGRVLTAGGQTLVGAGTLPDGGTPPDAGALPPSNVSGIFDVFCHAVTSLKPMASPRWLHTATLLPDGTVLVVGGSSLATPGTVLATTELHASPDTWSSGPVLTQARRGHSATLLFDGRVLVAGGETSGSLASSEIYDPVAKTWSPGLPLSAPRSRHGAVLLPNGKVLLVGGVGPMGTALATTDLFDPATGTWSAGATMADPRMGHFTQLLNDGRVLAIGGFSASGAAAYKSTEIYVPSLNQWQPGPSLTFPRGNFQAVLRTDNVLEVWGGADGLGGFPAGQELFNPVGDLLTTATYSSFQVSNFNAVPLASGEAAFIGGITPGTGASTECFLFKTALQYLDAMDTGTPAPLYDRTGTALPDGTVLFTGGSDGGVVSAAADLLDDGRATAPAMLPTLSPPEASWPGARITWTGTGFTGIGGGSSGNWHDSASNYPLLFVFREDNQSARIVPTYNWTPTSVSAVLPSDLEPGLSWAHVVVTGAPSVGQPLWIRFKPGSPCTFNAQCPGMCFAGTCCASTDAGACAGAVDGGADAGVDGGAARSADGGPVDAGASDAGSVGPLPAQDFRVGCGCSGGGGALGAIALAALALLRRRRRPQ